jgi:hypothetical protein
MQGVSVTTLHIRGGRVVVRANQSSKICQFSPPIFSFNWGGAFAFGLAAQRAPEKVRDRTSRAPRAHGVHVPLSCTDCLYQTEGLYLQMAVCCGYTHLSLSISRKKT